MLTSLKIIAPLRSVTVGKSNKINRKIWLASTLSKIPEGRRILDAGAGELANKKFCSHLDYVSQDFCQYDGDGDGSSLQSADWDTSKIDIISDITQIPEPDASFDAILCSEVLEHVPNPVMVFKEFNRLLKPRGILILTAPFCSLSHQAPFHFNTGFNRYFFQHHLEDNGFKIKELIPNGNYFEFIAQEILRIPNVNQKYVGLNINFFERVACKIILKMLQKLSKKDLNSSELLCFGYHLIGEKKT